MEKSPQAHERGPLRRTVRITNPQGFHLRSMHAFVKLGTQFRCDIRVCREGREPVDGKSPISLLMLSADCGMELMVETSGQDAPQALDALCDLLANLESRVEKQEG